MDSRTQLRHSAVFCSIFCGSISYASQMFPTSCHMYFQYEISGLKPVSRMRAHVALREPKVFNLLAYVRMDSRTQLRHSAVFCSIFCGSISYSSQMFPTACHIHAWTRVLNFDILRFFVRYSAVQFPTRAKCFQPLGKYTHGLAYSTSTFCGFLFDILRFNFLREPNISNRLSYMIPLLKNMILFFKIFRQSIISKTKTRKHRNDSTTFTLIPTIASTCFPNCFFHL